MYITLKAIHNILRWIVLLGGLWAVIITLKDLFSQGGFKRIHQTAGLIFTSSLNLQFLLGLVLYFVSPLVMSGWQNPSEAMANSQTRFFMVEHWLGMLVAIAIAQIGYSRAKRLEADRAKLMWAGISYVVALLIILAAIPWQWSALLPRF